MLGRRCRRRTNIDPTLAQCLVFAGMPSKRDTLDYGPKNNIGLKSRV